jgi:hypothetical protein
LQHTAVPNATALEEVLRHSHVPGVPGYLAACCHDHFRFPNIYYNDGLSGGVILEVKLNLAT